MKTLAWMCVVGIGLFLGAADGTDQRPAADTSGIRRLDARRARRLVAAFDGDDLALDGLQTLSTDAARALAEFKGRSLSLDGLKTLSPEAARALAGFAGKSLHLNGLTALSADAARALAAFKGARMWACRVLPG